jgi:hypothetical protein
MHILRAERYRRSRQRLPAFPNPISSTPIQMFTGQSFDSNF